MIHNEKNLRQIVLDTETTGMNQGAGPHYLGHRVIEIGCVELVNRKLTGRTFHQFIKPDRPVDAEAVKVHGITDDFLNDKPDFADIVLELIDFVRGSELIAHNAKFDIGFLNYELERMGKQKTLEQHCQVVDTLELARAKKNKGEIQGSLSLDALCRFYGIDNSHRTLHGALLDAEILADVYLYITGGQTKLDFASDIARQSVKGSMQAASQSVKTKVITATAEELEQHAKRLELVTDPIWYRQ